jgi:hypothetical protein
MNIDKFNPLWSFFKEKVKEFNETERDDIFYYVAYNFVKNKDKNKAILSILLSWNFRAYLRGGRRNLNSKQLNEEISDLLNKYSGKIEDLKSLMKIEFNNENEDFIKELYSHLINRKVFGSHTGVSKLLHIIKPDLFLMWDIAIRNRYRKKYPHISFSCQGYIEFLKETQKMAKRLFEAKGNQRLKELNKYNNYEYKLTIPKALDEYNMVVFNE